MLVTLAILTTVRASPISFTNTTIFPLNQLRANSCSDSSRTLWDLIRSCVLTILLCTWVSVHPNIPSPDEKWPKVTFRRVGLMFAALFAPEMVVAWAMRQRLEARELAQKHKGEGWTVTHGFFAVMGGFMLYEGNRPVRVLLPHELESYSLTGNGDFPRISKAEIEDKSKGDVISKGLVVLQTCWFVTQCIARGTKGLPVTELEIITVAFSVLNFVIYILWWDKPLNVQRGVRVYKKRESEQPSDDGQVEETIGFWRALRDALSEIPAAIDRGPVYGDEDYNAWAWPIRVLVWPMMMLVWLGFGSGYFGGDSEDKKKVEVFYPDEWTSGSLTNPARIVGIPIIASVFGGIHCVAWLFSFPSRTEQTLWHIASVSITAVPLTHFVVAPFIAVLLFALHGKDFLDEDFDIPLPWAPMFALALSCVILYLVSRLLLLALPFLALRSLPPGVYCVIDWAALILHLV